MSTQRTHDSSPFSEKKFPIILVAENLQSPANIGSLFRLADAFQIEKLILFGNNVDLSSNRLRRTARSTVNFVPHEITENLQQTIQHYVAQNYKLYCLEITDKSIPLETIELAENEKIILVLGEENFGVNKEILDQANATVHINMFGKNSSMNVAQAGGIALYEITKKLLAFQKK
ncbi:TrmH family RNA methyltransferase [Mesonia maritima]|uniref:tRNA G18 (Ribose-2'-O)-methylase SpoU n=1 Tax=Mesonia maritima TaxID=1793873 RepID=A0ABU1K7S8_9FLAO|nr:TrmH family RNA methyltransferase [Mesonia maritima]MDR6301658.1 tRNA G18 (ribose-2'-O)-methylase SpoU [Mesonia maritima]